MKPSFIQSHWVKERHGKRSRRVKYAFLRECGLSRDDADRLKDWTHNHIIKYLHANIEKIVFKPKKDENE